MQLCHWESALQRLSSGFTRRRFEAKQQSRLCCLPPPRVMEEGIKQAKAIELPASFELRYHAVFGLNLASIFPSNPVPASPASRVENSLPSSITGRLAHAVWKACCVAGDAVMSGP